MLNKICLWLTIIGGLNWGLVGLFKFNLVNFITMNTSFLENAVYILVGVASVISIYTVLIPKK